MAAHDIRVAVLLTADEFLSMQSMADEDGLSDSAFMRLLLRQAARKRAMAKLSEQRDLDGSAEPVQVLDSKRGAL